MVLAEKSNSPIWQTGTDLVVEEVVENVVNDDVDVQKDVTFYVGGSEFALVDSVKTNVKRRYGR